MADVLEADVKEEPNVGVGQAVVTHPARPTDLNDPMSPEEPQSVADGGLVQPGRGGQVADTQLARFEEAGQESEPTGIGQQPEHVGQVIDVLVGGQGSADRLHPVGIHHADLTAVLFDRAASDGLHI